MNLNDRVRLAIEETKSQSILGLIPTNYFEYTLASRQPGQGIGSEFSNPVTQEDLISCQWQEVEHPAIMPGCTGLVTEDLKGQLGVISLDDLDDSILLGAKNPKGVGWNMTIFGVHRPECHETFMIFGNSKGKEIVFTFHPGEPIPPDSQEEKPPENLTVQTAKTLGFKYAKII